MTSTGFGRGDLSRSRGCLLLDLDLCILVDNCEAAQAWSGGIRRQCLATQVEKETYLEETFLGSSSVSFDSREMGKLMVSPLPLPLVTISETGCATFSVTGLSSALISEPEPCLVTE